MGDRWLVTGATGFVGGALVRALVADGETVHVVVRRSLDDPAVLALPGLLVTAIFILTVIQKVWCGPLNEKWARLPDLTYNEGAVIFPATLLMFVLGVWPQFVLAVINPTVTQWVRQLPF